MEQTKFTIQSLLSQKGDSVSAPMSPMLFAKEMAEATGFKFNRLARLWFDDERINQKREDGGLTGFDTLLIGEQYDNDLWLSLWVDTGTGGVPVAMAYLSEESADFTEAYRKEHFARSLTDDEIQRIFNTVFENPGLIAVRQDGK